MSYIESLRKFAAGHDDRALLNGVIAGVEKISKTGFAPTQPDFPRKLIGEIARGETRGREKRTLLATVERACSKRMNGSSHDPEQNWQRIVEAARHMAAHAH